MFSLFCLRVLVLSNNSIEEKVPTYLTYCSELRELNVVDSKLEVKILETVQWASIAKFGKAEKSLRHKHGLELVGYVQQEEMI